MKCNLAGMNGCHDPGNDCLIIIVIIFIFSRPVAGTYFLFFTYVVVSGSGRDHSFDAIIFYYYYYFDIGRMMAEGFFFSRITVGKILFSPNLWL